MIILVASVGLFGCVNKESNLVTMDFVRPLLELPGPPMINYSTKYCTTSTSEHRIRNKYVIVLDRSLSNQLAPPDGIRPGSDPSGSLRFGKLKEFTESFIDRSGPSPSPAANASFALINFSDEDNYPASRMLRTGFVDALQFDSVLSSELQDVSAGDGINSTYGASTNYKQALVALQSLLASDVARYSESSAETPYYIVVFVSDGAPLIWNKDKTERVYINWTEIETELQAALRIADPSTSASEGIVFNTVLYYDPGQPPPHADCSSLMARERLQTSERCLLSEMARIGKGVYADVANRIDYSQFSVPTMSKRFGLSSFLLVNQNMSWDGARLIKDEDGDGLPDELEMRTEGFSHWAADSGGIAGVSDLVEYRLCGGKQCDPDQLDLAAKCPAGATLEDSDSDGLTDCEELLLGSSPTLFDSNGDLIPDGLAFRRGMAFKAGERDDELDSDWDGVSNARELKLNTPIHFDNNAISNLNPYRYSIRELGPESQRTCFNIEVKGVQVSSGSDELILYGIEGEMVQEGKLLMTIQKSRASDFINR